MKIEEINLIEFYIKKLFPYIMMPVTIIFYAFPFKGLHNSDNLIQRFGLPGYTYTIFILLFFVSFIVMIGSFFSEPKIKKKELKLTEESLYHKGGKVLRFNDFETYKLVGKHEITIDNKTVWKFTSKFGKERLVLYLLMSFEEKKEFETHLEKYAVKNKTQ
ncbi:hypothetical protein MM213_11450 [Belliella sp. R4-6]|uniref:YcxB-like protein domain-containing protein n=1 Tax=Belliella alkalica TaxID=1730871 RepID=A0ABS9VDI3_9BACT|nr:hypothetical protein [Belliella alkalica]MCH7414105.1 hypothetical protein [Belliella alkalica]